MKLDLTALRDATAALEKSLGHLYSDVARDPDPREQLRAASIRAFECTYEVAYKMIKRQLGQIAATPSEVDGMTYMQLIRSAAEAGLIADVPRFQEYCEERNITSHTYDQKRAEEVVALLESFLRDVGFLLNELERRNRAED